MLRSACLLVLASSLAVGSAACASSHPRPLEPAVPPRLAPPPPPPPAVPPGHLARVEVDHILTTRGPVWVLRQVMVDPVLRRDGEFSGWRVVGLPEDWRSIDVRPGDIVLRVNGLSVARPENLWTVWTTVASATEVKIDLMRDGAARQTIIPIDGAPSPETAKAMARASGPRPGSDAAPSGFESIRVGGGSGEADDDLN